MDVVCGLIRLESRIICIYVVHYGPLSLILCRFSRQISDSIAVLA